MRLMRLLTVKFGIFINSIAFMQSTYFNNNNKKIIIEYKKIRL